MKSEEMYRIYVTDSLKILTGTETRYADIVNPNKVDSKESANSIIKRLSAGLDKLKEVNGNGPASTEGYTGT